jgi:hypothetical protein
MVNDYLKKALCKNFKRELKYTSSNEFAAIRAAWLTGGLI